MKTIKLFNKALATPNMISFKTMNEMAVKYGYLVHESVCNQEVYDWISSQAINYSSTFYKTWNSILEKNRFELYLDQIKHYASTYGTDFTGQVFLPEETDVQEIPNFKEFKIISLLTKEEAFERTTKMLYSGIALSQETIEDILSILDTIDDSVDIDLVKNKEAKMFLYRKTNTLPTNPNELLRYLVFLSTSKTLLIKDKETIELIKYSRFDLSTLNLPLESLSTVFLRNKELFLAFKTNPNNKPIINKLRKLAIKNHVPLKVGFFEDILTNTSKLSELPERLKTLNNFKKIGLLQTINVRKKELNFKPYVIRNQKLFIKEDITPNNIDEYLDIVYDIIYRSLIKSLSTKATLVRLPKGLNLTLPVSEKSFVGNLPLGSSFDFSETDNVLGINWKSVDGADDLDLKLIDIDGTQYGWNAAFKNSDNSCVFSGDMTSADPEATELFYASKTIKPSIVKVNIFSGNLNSKFKFFIGREKIDLLTRNYMIDPNNICFSVDCKMDSREKILGVVTGEKFIVVQFRTGKGAVAGNSVTNLYTEYALKTYDCYLSLEKVLSDSGFSFVNDNDMLSEEQAKNVLDLTEISKDSLISLLS